MRFRRATPDSVTDTSDQCSGALTEPRVDTEFASPELAPGPELLMEGRLFAEWFIRYELEKELQRARRHERPISIVVLTPVPSIGERPTGDALDAAALAAKASARATDLIGWLPNDRILLILPETDKDGAAAASHRWRTEMYTRTLSMGALRWVVTMSVDPSAYENAEELLNSLSAAVV